MREQAFSDFEGTEDCRLERVLSMDMKRRTLCQISSDAYHGTIPRSSQCSSRMIMAFLQAMI